MLCASRPLRTLRGLLRLNNITLPRRCCDRTQDRAWTARGLAEASITSAARRLAAGDSADSRGAGAAWKSRSRRSKRSVLPAAAARARQADLDREVEDHGQVGREIAEREAVQRGELGRAAARCRSPDRPGSNWRSGRETTQTPRGKAGAISLATMVCARAATISSASLDGVPALALAFEQQIADLFGAGRAARLAGRPGGDAGLAPARRPAARPGSTCRRPRRLRR